MPLILPPFEERIRHHVEPLEAVDGTRRTFTVDEPFVENTIQAFHNGRELERTTTTSPCDGDFVISESGGLGTGYDTIEFLRITPTTKSSVRFSYVVE